MKSSIFIFLFVCLLGTVSIGQTTSGADQSNKYIRYYPNPASTFINFDYQKGYSSGYSLLIFNFMGKKVYEIKNTPSRMNLSLSDFYRGIYIYQLRDKNGQMLESGKFQVAK